MSSNSKTFKFEEHFAKRSSIQFERFGGRKTSILVTDEPSLHTSTNKSPTRIPIVIDQIIASSPSIIPTPQIGMKLKE